MSFCRLFARNLGLVAAWLVLALGAAASEKKSSLPAALEKKNPESLADLLAIQEHVKAVLKKVLPAVVGLEIGMANGSGVIVSAEGHVLTAAHVMNNGHASRDAGRSAVVSLMNGRRLAATTKGSEFGADTGMLQVVAKSRRELPWVEMGRSAEVQPGQWCLALGYPGRFEKDRGPVVRLARVLDVKGRLIVSDAAMMGGDSGGPLFDMHGRVIGIHSTAVPGRTSSVGIDAFHKNWERLAKGEIDSSPDGFSRIDFSEGYLGVRTDPKSAMCVVAEVIPGSPADRAGVRPGDVLLAMGTFVLEDALDLRDYLLAPDWREFRIELRRAGKIMSVPVKLQRKAPSI